MGSTSHVSRKITALQFSGSTRGILSINPPPVICARPFIPQVLRDPLLNFLVTSEQPGRS